LPYYYRKSINAQRDGIVGFEAEDKYSDTGIMLNEPLNEEFVKFLIEKFASKNNIKIIEILRGRANLTCRSSDNRPMDPHVDLRRVVKNYNFVYYANDSDGCTNLFSQKYTGENIDVDSLKIFKSFTPQSGYALFFDGDIFHNWEYPDKNNFRFSVVINITCEVDESLMEKVPF
jgi:hypothetical protein